MKPETRARQSIWAMLVVALTLPLLYIGSYLAMLTPREVSLPGFLVVGVPKATSELRWREAEYRVANDILKVVFWPANWVDMKLRPEFWGEPWPVGSFLR